MELVSSDSSTVQALSGDSWSNTEFVYWFVGGRSYAYRHDRLVDGSQAYRRDSCQFQVAVRCERRVVIVVERRARLSVGR